MEEAHGVIPAVASPVQLGNPWRESVFLELASKLGRCRIRLRTLRSELGQYPALHRTGLELPINQETRLVTDSCASNRAMFRRVTKSPSRPPWLDGLFAFLFVRKSNFQNSDLSNPAPYLFKKAEI